MLKGIGETQIIHIPRELNKETNTPTNGKLEDIVLARMKFQCPKMQGVEDLADVKHFLLIEECPQHLEKVQRRQLTLKVTSYQLIGEDLYHKGKDLVLRRVPTKDAIHHILESCHG